MPQQPDIALIFRQIYTVVRKYGVENVLKKLREIEAKADEPSDVELIDIIINNVCKEFNVKRDTLFQKNKNARASEARRMCYVLIKTYLRLSNRQIAWFFNQHDKSVWRAIMEYQSMSTKIKWQKDFIEKKNLLTIKIDHDLTLIL